MSINSKLRKLADQLPYFPRIKPDGTLNVTYRIASGEELLMKDPERMIDGKKIDKDKSYRVPIVLCADHFHELRKAWDYGKEPAVRTYCEMVHAYQKNKEKVKAAMEVAEVGENMGDLGNA
jgi:hypothetical protein